MASPDPVALTWWPCMWRWADPMTVPYLKACREHGVGETNLEDIDILGERLSEVQIPDFVFFRMDGIVAAYVPLAGPLRKRLSPVRW